MSIFKGIPPDKAYETIEAAAAAICHAAEAQGLGASAWSLAELRPDQEDYTWLCDWMRHLSSGVAARCLQQGPWRKFTRDGLTFSYSAGFGALLLMSAVEVARQQATLGSLWTAVGRGPFPETTRALLFVQSYRFSSAVSRSPGHPPFFLQGYPTRAYKDAVEQAARWLHLRHVFGIEGVQNWYDTVYLQFGFSRPGFMRRLPEWLVGQGQTQSIQQLLSGPMRSESFCALWQALRYFRSHNWTEAQLRGQLDRNPWVLPEWADDLVKAARAKPYLNDESERAAAPLGEGIQDPFLSTPRLRWNLVDAPHFVCAVTNLAALDLQEDSYDIVIADQTCGRLQRTADGTYLPSAADIELPAIAPLLVASLVAPGGQLAQSLTLELWDANEDVTAFSAGSGERFDPWKQVMRPQAGTFLLLAADLSLEPEARFWHAFPAWHAKLYYLAPGWSQETRVLLGDQVLWQPSLTSPPARGEAQTRARAIGVQLHDPADHLFFGERARLAITLPGGLDLTFLRAGGQPLAFERLTSTCALTEPFAVTPKLFGVEDVCRIELLLGVKTGSTEMRLRHVVDLPITGAAVLTSQGWTALRPGDALELEQGRLQPVKVFVMEIDRWVLLEGDLWVGRPWKTPRPLTALSGFGAPLQLCEGAYNHYRGTRVLAGSVIDHGTLAAVEVDALGSPTRTIALQLSRSIEAGAEHTILWWDQNGAFQTLVPECCELQGQEMWWLASVGADLTEPLAIAIAYCGTRLGSWWSAEWHTSLRRLMRRLPHTLAALLRWFHLPVLSERYREEVRRFAFVYPGETLAAWVGESGLPSTLQWSEVDDGWLSAVRAIFWPVPPLVTPIKQIIAPLLPEDGAETPQEVLPALAWKLLRVSPLLMGLIVKRWALEEGIPRWGARHVRVLLHQLRDDMAEVTSSLPLYSDRARLLEQVADTMNVDPLFVERALIGRALSLFQGQEASRLDQENLAVAMNVEPFRRLLGVRVLAEIDAMIGERSAR